MDAAMKLGMPYFKISDNQCKKCKKDANSKNKKGAYSAVSMFAET